ncbi:DNA polymerase III subunit gamma/tau [Spirochaetota bacterium]
MAYENTAQRKRPQNFDDLAGQDFVSLTLRSSIANGRIAHAYLFSGPRGCGKTSTARILAKSLNCENGPTDKPCGVCASCVAVNKGTSMDVIEIDGASNTSVDNIRQIKDEVLFPPAISRYKIYIIDEVHMLSNSAFNALLKTIEEPPPYIVFIFATTELHKVPATIKSRCQHFAFRLFSVDVIVKLLEEAALDIKTNADREALLWIAKEAGGSMRDAYTLFDQILSFSDGHITKEKIKEKLGLVGSESMAEILGHCIAGRRPEALSALDTILEQGLSIEQFNADAAAYVRSLLFIKSGVEKDSLLCYPRAEFPEKLVSAFDQEKLEYMLLVLFELHRSLRYCINPRWELELVISRLCMIGDYISASRLADTIHAIQTAIKEGHAPGAAALGAELRQSLKPDTKKESNRARTEAEFMNAGIQESVVSADSGPDLSDLKEKIVGAIGRNRVVLAACLERSGQWFLDDDKIVIPCQNSYDAGAVLADSGLLAKKISEMSGRALRVEPRTLPSSAKNGSDDKYSEADADIGQNQGSYPDYDEASGWSEQNFAEQSSDPVKIVEKVFKGRRIE